MNPGSILVKEYEIIRTIGSGGMGDVYQARRLRDGAYVAIKILREDLIKDREAVARFRRESRAAAALRSPHAARIFNVGETENHQPFIVMEFLEGWDLMTEIDTRGALPVEEAVSYVAQACHAMIEAHELGIVHRDLKPPNLFLAKEGDRRVVKVLDFGISKVTQLTDGHVTSTQMSFGSPLYMSPEQIRSTKLVDARSDVWSLGVILYESLTGEPPFMAESAGGLAVVISVEPHPPASHKRRGIPPALDDIIDGALQKDPKKRYSSVKEFLHALEDYLPRDASTKNKTLVIDPPKEVWQRPPVRRFTPPMQAAQGTQAQPGMGGQPMQNPQIAGQHGPAAFAHTHVTAATHGRPPSLSDIGAPVSSAEGKTLVIPPRITLGPATTDPPVSPGLKKERIGLILAAFLIPLGAIAFGFAIWLYAKRGAEHTAASRSSVEVSATPKTPQTAPPSSDVTMQRTPIASEGAPQSTATTSASAATSAKGSEQGAKKSGATKHSKQKTQRTGPLLPEHP